MMGSISCVDTLLSAIKSNDASTYLLDSTDIAKTDADGWSPFLYAVYREHVPCALKLLQQRNYAKVSQLTYESDSFIISNSSSKSGSFPSSSSSSSSSLSSSRIMVMNEYVSDAKLFELYDKDQATSQLRVIML
jgi:ankyrin repeat protein